MRLSRLSKRYRRLIRWSGFLLAMAGVGVALYVMLPPEPRWVLADGPKEVFYAGDGRIATYRVAEGVASGPVQLWDAATGCEAGRFLTDEPFQAHASSDDGRYFVALVKGEKKDVCRIRGVDLQEPREWQVDARAGPFKSARFSPRCNYVVLRQWAANDAENSYAIFETSTGRIVARFELAVTEGLDDGTFAGDGGCFLIGYRDEDNVNHIQAVSTRAGKTTVIDDARFIAVSPDSRWLIADRGDDAVWVWDLASSSWHCELQGAQSRRALNLLQGDAIAIEEFAVDRVTARALRGLWHAGVFRFRSDGTGSFWQRGAPGDNPIFSPDSRYVLCSAGTARSILYDVEARKQLWQRTWAADQLCDPLFTPDSRRMIVALALPDRIEVQDAATGEIELTVPVPGSAALQTWLTRDGRTLVVVAAPLEEPAPWLWKQALDWLAPRPAGSPVLIRVFDLETGLLLGRVHGQETDPYWLTEDRQSLVMVYNAANDGHVVETTIRCWDMPPQRPLRWALGVALVFGAMLLLLRAAWHRLPRKRSAGAPTPQ